MGRGSRPGQRRGGRARGTPNVSTVEVKAAIESAFKGIGGVPALIAWAEQNRDLFYVKVWTRIVPRELAADLNATVTTRQDVRQHLVDQIVCMLDSTRRDAGSLRDREAGP